MTQTAVSFTHRTHVIGVDWILPAALRCRSFPPQQKCILLRKTYRLQPTRGRRGIARMRMKLRTPAGGHFPYFR